MNIIQRNFNKHRDCFVSLSVNWPKYFISCLGKETNFLLAYQVLRVYKKSDNINSCFIIIDRLFIKRKLNSNYKTLAYYN